LRGIHAALKARKTEQWGWEIDHIKPVSKGGTDDLSNLEPLQWENNRQKAYRSYPRGKLLSKYDCIGASGLLTNQEQSSSRLSTLN
jgi:hypothetical protein